MTDCQQEMQLCMYLYFQNSETPAILISIGAQGEHYPLRRLVLLRCLVIQRKRSQRRSHMQLAYSGGLWYAKLADVSIYWTRDVWQISCTALKLRLPSVRCIEIILFCGNHALAIFCFCLQITPARFFRWWGALQKERAQPASQGQNKVELHYSGWAALHIDVYTHFLKRILITGAVTCMG